MRWNFKKVLYCKQGNERKFQIWHLRFILFFNAHQNVCSIYAKILKVLGLVRLESLPNLLLFKIEALADFGGTLLFIGNPDGASKT